MLPASTANKRTSAGWPGGVSPRTIQLALGWLWIIDAFLQYQPAMYTGRLVTDVILPSAAGQPYPESWSITTLGHLVSHGTGTWNAAFATLQLAIGIGLLVRRWVRPTLVVMFAWCLGVWWLGEGFGGLLTGTATPLTGAPGSVLLYAVIGVLIWPRRDPAPPAERQGVATSALAQGPLGVGGALAAWSGFWLLSAVLWLLPANRTASAVSDAIAAMSGGEPGWYSHFLTSVANLFAGAGEPTAWLVAVASLVIGLGPLLTSRPVPFLAAGALLQLAFWITGMALGGILTGLGTDPDTAPLIVLLALGLVPAVAASRRHLLAGAPVRGLTARHPGLALATLAAAVTAVAAGICYPMVAAASLPAPAPLAIPTTTTTTPAATPAVTTPAGGPATVQFNAPSTFSCLAQEPWEAQVTIGFNVPSATSLGVRFDGAPIHIGIQRALPFDVPAGPPTGPGTTLVFACHAGDQHTITLTWRGDGLSPTRRIVTVHKVAAP